MKHNLQIKDKDGFIYDVNDVNGNTVTALTDSGKLIDFNKSDVLFILQGVPVDYKYLFDWYIQSVDAHTPVWTEKHLEELFKDFYLIPKSEIESPAMLSEEYLINLGFEAEGYPDEREYHLGVIKLIKLVGNDFYIADLFGQEVEFRYVYELQNLLSLCKDIIAI